MVSWLTEKAFEDVESVLVWLDFFRCEFRAKLRLLRGLRAPFLGLGFWLRRGDVNWDGFGRGKEAAGSFAD